MAMSTPASRREDTGVFGEPSETGHSEEAAGTSAIGMDCLGEPTIGSCARDLLTVIGNQSARERLRAAILLQEKDFSRWS